MTRNQVISHFGNITRAAEFTGYSRFAIHRWKLHGIPYRSQLAIEQMTGGLLKATKRTPKK